MTIYIAAGSLLLNVVQIVILIAILYWVYEFHLRDKARKELVDALSRAFVDKDSKLLQLLNDKCGTGEDVR